MRIFLAHASEDAKQAERIQLALLGPGHEVFFDERSLPPGGDYNSRIRTAVEQSDRLVFLISPDSVEPGRYTRTELEYAKRKWPKPWGKVLGVMVRTTPEESIPPYLGSTTVVRPVGNLAAEALDAFERMSDEPGQVEPGPAGTRAADAGVLEEADDSKTVDEAMPAGAPAALADLLKASLALGKWKAEIARHGRQGQSYTKTIGGDSYMATPSAEYTDEKGRRCRTIRGSKRVQGQWIETPAATLFWKEGDWFLIPASPEEPDRSGAAGRRPRPPAARVEPDGTVVLADDEPFVRCAHCGARVKARNMDLHLNKVHPNG